MAISEDVTTVAITKATHERLRQLKAYGDSYDHVINRLLQRYTESEVNDEMAGVTVINGAEQRTE